MNRRTVSGLCLIASAGAYLASQFCWPDGSDADVATTMRAATAHPVAWTLALSLEAVSALLAVPGAIGVSTWLRRRGRVLGLLGAIGAVLACVAFAAGGVMNAMTLVAASHLPPAEATTVYDAMGTNPYLVAIVPLFFLGGLGGILLAVGTVRGGLAPWWVIGLAGAGALIQTFLNNGLDAPLTGLIYLPNAAATVVVAVRLLTAPPVQPEPAPAAEAPAAVASLA